MMYNMLYAAEISRIVHEERMALDKRNRMLRELALANRLEVGSSPLQQMRKVMSRVMSLLF
jgi:hypothetical protein